MLVVDSGSEDSETDADGLMVPWSLRNEALEQCNSVHDSYIFCSIESLLSHKYIFCWRCDTRG